LYAEGYTYLGNKKNCFRNNSLRNKDGTYRPAWEAKEEFETQSRKKDQDECECQDEDEC
jgi:hypothetical protein